MLVKPEHLDRLRAQGNCLKVEGAQEAEVPATPVTSGEQVGTVDWLILSVKTKDTAAALAAAAGCTPAAAISLQNGVVKDGWLHDAFGAAAVVGASTTFGATYLGVGHARYTFPATTWLGEIGGGTSPRVNEFADLLTNAGLAGYTGRGHHGHRVVEAVLPPARRDGHCPRAHRLCDDVLSSAAGRAVLAPHPGACLRGAGRRHRRDRPAGRAAAGRRAGRQPPRRWLGRVCGSERSGIVPPERAWCRPSLRTCSRSDAPR